MKQRLQRQCLERRVPWKHPYNPWTRVRRLHRNRLWSDSPIPLHPRHMYALQQKNI